MITGYMQEARQRFHEFGGFWQMEPDRLPGSVAMWADSLWVRTEPGLTTLMALVPAAQDGALRSVRDGMTAMAQAIRKAERTEVQGILLIVTDRPLTRPEYDRWQELKLHAGPVRLVPWIVDLPRGRVFQHVGMPFGIDPDLAVLAVPELAMAAVPQSGAGVSPPARSRRPTSAEPRPWMTMALLAIIIGIGIAMAIKSGSLELFPQSTAQLAQWGAANRPYLWLDHQPWRLLTAVFIHIGAVHLALNGLSLWSVGRPVEFLFGPLKLLFIFLVAGVAGSTASAILGPPVVVSAGASGAIFGLLGAVIWYRLSSPQGARVAWRPLLISLGVNLGIGLSLYHIIDNWNHLGGLAGGMLAAAVIGVPEIAGERRPRFHLPRPVRAVVAAALLLGAAAVVTGAVDLPGPGRDLARGLVALDAGRPAEAEPAIRRAAVLQPDEPNIRGWLVQTYAETGECQKASAEMTEVERLLPDLAPEDRQQLQQLIRNCQAQRH